MKSKIFGHHSFLFSILSERVVIMKFRSSFLMIRLIEEVSKNFLQSLEVNGHLLNTLQRHAIDTEIVVEAPEWGQKQMTTQEIQM
jgi:hypothetical protein